MFDRRFLDFNFCVEGIANDTPSGFSPTDGVQFIVGSEPEGDFSDAQPNYIARYDRASVEWKFLPPQQDFFEVFNLETHELLKYDGSNWVKATKFENFYTVDDVIKIALHEDETLPNSLVYNEGELYLQYDPIYDYTNLIPLLHNYDEYYYNGTLSEFFEINYLNSHASNGDNYLSLLDKAIVNIIDASDGRFSKKQLLKGDSIFSKANNSLYYFDGNNIKKIGGQKFFTVRNIANIAMYEDFTLSATQMFDGTGFQNLSTGDKILSCKKNIGFKQYTPSVIYDRFIVDKLVDKSRYICLKDYNNNITIFTMLCVNDDYYYWSSEELLDGSIIYNEADDCFYIYNATNKKLENLSEKKNKIVHVADMGYSFPYIDKEKLMRYIEDNLANVSNICFFTYEGNEYFTYFHYKKSETSIYYTFYYSFNEDNIPDDRLKELSSEKYFYSINEHTIWVVDTKKCQPIYEQRYNIFIEDGTIIINDYDGSKYIYNLATGLTPYIEANAPVNDIIEVVVTLPETGVSIGDKFLKFDDAKIYTVTNITQQNNNDVITWDAGVATSDGDRYASKDKKVIYTSNGTSLTSSVLLEGSTFLNKADGYIYICTNEGKIKAVDEFFTEVHTITADEATNKTFNLTYGVKSGKETNLLCFVVGNIKTPNVDFTVSGNAFTWTTANFAENDVVIIHYIKA